jgi:hypothetical protein
LVKKSLDLRNQRLQISYAIPLRQHDDHRNRQGIEALLILNTSISGHHRNEPRTRGSS